MRARKISSILFRICASLISKDRLPAAGTNVDESDVFYPVFWLSVRIKIDSPKIFLL